VDTLILYDLETTVTDDPNESMDIIEFGALILERDTLTEVDSYSTLLYSDRVTPESEAINGISKKMLKDAPAFTAVADRIYELMHHGNWVGHNIKMFDNQRLREAFARIERLPPEPLHVIDTLPLLRKHFGLRAGDMRMASLGHHFKLGDEKHRAIDDCRMTLEVLKHCAAILFLEQHAGLGSEGPDLLSLLEA